MTSCAASFTTPPTELEPAPAAEPVALLPVREEPERPSDLELARRIVDEHHAPARRALPYVTALLAKTAGFHRHRNPKLAALCDAGQELADRLESWMDAEERDLLPAFLSGGPAGEDVRRDLDRLARRHRMTALLLARIRWLADDFAIPSWADRGYQALMEELEALERGQLEHVRLEQAELAPRLASRSVAAA